MESLPFFLLLDPCAALEFSMRSFRIESKTCMVREFMTCSDIWRPTKNNGPVGNLHASTSISLHLMIGLYVCVVIVTTILTGGHAHECDAMLNSRRGMIVVRNAGERRSKRRMILGPLILLKTMLYDPVRRLDRNSLLAAYTIDRERHHAFFVVTVSRLFYYCGGSIQTVRLLPHPHSSLTFPVVEHSHGSCSTICSSFCIFFMILSRQMMPKLRLPN